LKQQTIGSFEMTQDAKPKLPIGYWLKQADKLLTQQINQAHTSQGVSRSDWQVLNMLKELGSASRESIFETMHTFVDADGFNQIISALSERKWIESRRNLNSGIEESQLTEEGHHQHEIIFTTQKKIRQQAMQDISEEEYSTVIRVLQQIVSNLEGEPNGTT
jgi:DNA-binding MarR family transcriptional regulator